MKAKVNYNAIETWLEPYIGHEFEVYAKTKNYIWFWIDYGDKAKGRRYERIKEEIKYFEIL
jgi:hypothetical protein